jgi:CBS domain
MIVHEIMTTTLVTVEPDDTLSHAAHLLRQYQFHHLPVVRTVNVAGSQSTAYTVRRTAFLFEGLLTSQDIELAVALAEQGRADSRPHQPWQDTQHHRRPACRWRAPYSHTPCGNNESLTFTPSFTVGRYSVCLCEPTDGRGNPCLIYFPRAEHVSCSMHVTSTMIWGRNIRCS